MNEYTFMFVMNPHNMRHHRGWVPHLGNVQFGNTAERQKVKQIFVLRWRTKYAYSTARKHAFKVVAEHCRRIILDDPIAWSDYIISLLAMHPDNINTLRRIVEPFSGVVVGYPEFVRLDQPENCK